MQVEMIILLVKYSVNFLAKHVVALLNSVVNLMPYKLFCFLMKTIFNDKKHQIFEVQSNIKQHAL